MTERISAETERAEFQESNFGRKPKLAERDNFGRKGQFRPKEGYFGQIFGRNRVLWQLLSAEIGAFGRK